MPGSRAIATPPRNTSIGHEDNHIASADHFIFARVIGILKQRITGILHGHPEAIDEREWTSRPQLWKSFTDGIRSSCHGHRGGPANPGFRDSSAGGREGLS